MSKLLIVDDDEGTLAWMKAALQSSGHDVRVADAVRIALSIAAEWRPDLILADILMPETDGFTFAAKVQRIHNAPLMFISIARREAEAILRGAAGYVSKPVTANELRVAVEKVLGRSSKDSTILVVDDDESIRDCYRGVLEPRFRVLDAPNGRVALDLLAHEDVSLAIVDVHMPVMNGVEFVRALRADPRVRQLPVIIQTSDVSAMRAPVWVDLHVEQTLLKDQFLDWLLAQIGAHTDEMARSRPLGSSASP